MEAKDVLPIIFERSNATGAIWNLYIVVVLGVIAFLASTEIKNTLIRHAVAIGFVIMAVDNILALVQVTRQEQELVTYFHSLNTNSVLSGKDQGLFDPLFVSPWPLVAVIHAIIDLMVLAFIYNLFSKISRP